VVTECVKTGMLIDQARFASSITPKETWGGWVMSIGWSAVQSLGDRVVGHSPGSLVVPQVAEQLMEELLLKLRNLKPMLRLKKCQFLSEDDLQDFQDTDSLKLIEFLSAKKLVAVTFIDNAKFYKVSLDISTISFDETDVGIIKLFKTMDTLDNEIENLESEVKTIGIKVKELLKSNSRQSAKSLLRRQKNVEKNLEKKLAQKVNTESILDEILSAESNKCVIDSYKAGLDALKSALNDKSLDDVDDLMDEINDTVNKGEDLTSTISKNTLDVSIESDLEQELIDIYKEDSDLDISKELANSSGTKEDKELLDLLDKLEFEDKQIPMQKHHPEKEKVLLAS